MTGDDQSERRTSDSDEGTTAFLLTTFAWESDVPLSVTNRYIEMAVESLIWQRASADSRSQIMMALFGSLKQNARVFNRVGHERLGEILGLMGAIGEQAGLAWTAMQDAQRYVQTSDRRDDLTQRFALRALSEQMGHYILGASHSLGNLVLRTLMIDADASAVIIKRHTVKDQPEPDFSPNSDDRFAWLTLNLSLLRDLKKARRGASPAMTRLTEPVISLQQSTAFRALDDRRGMDYHRRRPQSVKHDASRSGVTEVTEDGGYMMVVRARYDDHDADGNQVFRVATDAFIVLTATMTQIAERVGDAIRDEGIAFHADEGWDQWRSDEIDKYYREQGNQRT